MCRLPTASAAVNPLRRRRGATLALGAALLAGAASCVPVRTRPTDAGLSTTWACVPDTTLAALPAVAALVDVDALTASLAPLRGEAPAGGEVVLTMEYEPDGTNVRRDVMEHSVTPVLADTVQELVFSARRQTAAAAEPWGVRLRVRLAQPVAYAVERREYCPPRPRDRQLQFAMESPMTGTRYRGGDRERTLLVRVRVHPAGYVHSAWLYRGADRGVEFERELFNSVRRYSFYPAMLDGRPVFGEVTVPVRIRA
jgi:hypothetical protein